MMRCLIWVMLLLSTTFSDHVLAGDPLQKPHGDISSSITAVEGDVAVTRGQEPVFERPILIEKHREPEVPAQLILDSSPPFSTPWTDTANSHIEDYIFDLGREARFRMERQHARFRQASKMPYDVPEYQSQPPDYNPPLLFWYPSFWFFTQVKPWRE